MVLAKHHYENDFKLQKLEIYMKRSEYSHIFVKNELRVFLIRKPEWHLLAMLRCVCNDWLRQIDVI